MNEVFFVEKLNAYLSIRVIYILQPLGLNL